MRHKTVVALVMLVALGGVTMVVQAQEKETATAETRAEVPALTQFHTVIYKLWHTAWPNRDYQMLIDLWPEVERHSAAVAAATLPGILREKQKAWEENLGRLKEVVTAYKTAIDQKDNQALLDAAERLHMQYEKLVRTIRPALPQLEDFHTVLYMLYHYHMPAYDLPKIRTAVSALQEKMAALNQAQLPPRWQSKNEAFLAGRARLATAVEALAATLPSEDEDKIKSAIEAMHTQYEALQHLFE